MRLWSLHPRFLDARGLIALWREALLARKVLKGETKGYVHHPQLVRFRAAPEPLSCIETYLDGVYRESLARRGYHFDKKKLGECLVPCRITVTSGQMHYEMERIREKLKARDILACERISGIKEPEPHPLFQIIPGPIEPWEVVKERK